MAGDDKGEAYARAVLKLALGATFTDVDHGTSGGPPGMPDGLFVLPSGQLGALEVTTIADQHVMATEGTVAKTNWEVDKSMFGWEIHISSSVQIDLDRMRSALPRAILLAERHGHTDLGLVGVSKRWDPELVWLRSVIGTARITKPGGPVRVYASHTAACWIPPDFSGLDEWVSGLLDSPLVASKVRKLKRTERPDLHLFLRLHPTKTTSGLSYLCAFTDLVPDAGQTISTDLAGVWLASRWDTPLLHWDGTRWARFQTA